MNRGDADSATAAAGRSETLFASLVTLLFVAVCGFAAAHHEIWRDEAQAWLLARDATGIGDLFARIRYERHPALWHVLLYFVSRITHRPEAMQLLNLAVATGGVFLFARAAPFSRWARALFCFGYFPLYEYGVLARNYAIGMLLLFAATALFSRRREHPWMFGGALALAAHTSAPALLVAATLAAAAALDALLSRDRRRELAPAAKSCALTGAAIVVALVQLLPPADAGYLRGDGWTSSVDRVRGEQVLGLFAKALLPISKSTPFWDRVWLEDLNHHVGPAIAAFCIIAVIVHLARRRSALVVFVLGNAVLLSFFYVKMAGSIRHHGFLFLSLVIALWIARQSAPESDAPGGQPAGASSPGSPAWGWAAAGVLLVQLAAALVALRQEQRLVFSAGRAAAELIEARGLARLPFVGDVDVAMSPILAYLDKDSMYFPRGRRAGSYVIWDRARLVDMTDDDVFGQAVEQRRRLDSAVVVVLNRVSPVAAKWGAHEVACVTADVVDPESYCVYTLEAP